uniref:Uncharacterized protein n=1 Tax=Mus musculus TaxID=10090 RepID=Q3UQ51_MOUSE|nr:unnamed protein product [Mus musculus]
MSKKARLGVWLTLGRHEEALEMAADLESKATNTDHLTVVLHLHLAVFSSLQSREHTILFLHKLIALHPLNPWSWCKLAEAYLSPGPGLPAGVSRRDRRVLPQVTSPPSLLCKLGNRLSFVFAHDLA